MKEVDWNIYDREWRMKAQKCDVWRRQVKEYAMMEEKKQQQKKTRQWPRMSWIPVGLENWEKIKELNEEEDRCKDWRRMIEEMSDMAMEETLKKLIEIWFICEILKTLKKKFWMM
jgi:hypothetical protein